MVTRYLRWLKIICLFLTWLWTASSFAVINVSVDRQPVHLDESFQLSFATDGSLGSPELSPLSKDFDILSTSQSSSTSIINGKMIRSNKLILNVIAKRQGRLPIPAITFGKERSQPTMIEVKAANQPATSSSGDDIFFQAEAKPQRSYVQQQILFTVRLFYAVSISNGNLSEPKLSGTDAVIQKMEGDKSYQTQHGNRRYNVHERRYAIFPQASGSVTIEPLLFQGQIGGSSFLRSGKQIAKRTAAITLDIQPPPTVYQGPVWLPAQNITLQETWPATAPGQLPTFHVGQPITRTITLRAQGLTASQLPELPELQATLGNNFKQYPDQPTLSDQVSANGINGTRVEKVAIIPAAAGQYTLPELIIPWWDTDTNQQHYARLPKQTIKVLPAVTSITDNTAPTKPQQTVATEQLDSQAEGTAANPLVAPMAMMTDTNGWQYLSLFFALIWLLTMLGYLRLYFRQSRSSGASFKDSQQAKDSLRETMARLKHACKTNDPKAAKESVLGWHQHYADAPASSLGELSKQYDDKLAHEIRALNELLYGGAKQTWDGQPLWDAIQAQQQQVAVPDKAKVSNLQPLYRL